jgi:3-oxoadipate enol-lactonase
MTTLALRSIPAPRRASALYCTVHGSGTPLLLIHGLGVSGTIFEALLPALAAHYQVIIPDLRGHGQSRRLPGPDSVARLAADVENLLDLMGVPACFVFGYASGGAVAQQLAHDYPARTRGLVLACSYARSACSLRKQIESRLRPELFRLFGTRGIGTLAARLGCLHGAPAEDYTFVRDMIAANSSERVASIARALLAFDSRPWLHTLTCPTLVIAGESDTTTPPCHARELAAHLPGAELRVLPRAGHWLVKTHAGVLLDVVLPWLAGHARETTA